MSNSKKIISLLLSAIMIMSVFNIVPFTASAAEAEAAVTGAESGTTGDCTWTLDNGVLTISGNGKMEDYYAPWDSYDFNTVVIESGVTSIGDSAFSGCTELTSLTIPDSVTSIGSFAFYDCSNLTSITIPDSVTSIGDSAFGYLFDESDLIDNKVDDFTIYGYPGSEAECYADDNGFTFVPIRPSTVDEATPDEATPDEATPDEATLDEATPDEATPDEATPDEAVPISGTTGDCTWIVEGTVLTISGNGRMREYYPYEAPWVNFGITKLIIKDGVTHISGRALSQCTELTSIDIPDSVTSIGSSAFSGCTGLTSLDIHESVTHIGSNAFSGCSGLKSIRVSEGNTAYEDRDNCNAVIDTESNKLIIGCMNTVIPDSVTSIGERAFSGCTGLTNIDIPDSVTSIGERAFSGCTGLTNIDIPDSVTSIGSAAFSDCSGLTSIDIPDSVTSIGYEAFYRCSGLTSIDIPDSVTSIGNYAFSDCIGLTSIYIPDSVTSIGKNAFFNTAWYNAQPDGLIYCGDILYSAKGMYPIEVEVKQGTVSIADFAFCYQKELYSVTLPDSVTSIGSAAFFGSGLTSVTIPDSVTSIGREAFSDCSGLTSIDIPDSVTSIEAGAFSGCTRLKSIDIPDSVTSIGRYAFSGCTGLTSVDIPDSVTSISDGVFSNCPGLTSIDIPDSVTSIGYYAFSDCSGLTSVTIPDSVTSIGDYAFSDCSGLTSVTIPDSVKSIGNYAFSDCSGLTSVNIGNSVTSIGGWAFEGCTSLTSVTIPDSVTSIGDYAFYSCTRLTSVTIPDSVISIGNFAFVNTAWFNNQPDGPIYAGKVLLYVKGDCPDEIEIEPGTLAIAERAFVCIDKNDPRTHRGYKNLKIVIFPNSLKCIGEEAFYGCEGLTSIDLPDSVTSIGLRAFGDCTNLCDISVPDSVTNIRGSAFSNTAWYNNQPDGLVYIGKVAYKMKGTCPAEVEIKPDAISISDYAFQGCNTLKKVIIPDSVLSIGNNAFQGCNTLKEVIIPDSVLSIGNYAFTDCPELKSVTIPSTVTNIGQLTFGIIVISADGYSYTPRFTIYGYEGSEAERYATDNSFKFIKLTEKTDEATGIILDIPEDTDLTVKDITSEIVCNLPDGCNKMTAYDITLTKNGETVQPGNIVPVKIPCENENAKVYHFEADGKMTDMNAEYKDGYMVFTTDHFSIYVLVEPKSEGVTVPGDVTGDGKTNVQDCTAILRYVRQIDALSDDQLKIGDVTGDGKVNVQDVTRILRHVRQIEALY